MKTLYLVRHAKSSWVYNLDDHERPLNEKGLNDAPRVAKEVLEGFKHPGLILSSDAVRAKTTAILYLKALNIPDSELILKPKLYDFNGDEVERIIRACDDSITCLMIFGHNNAMTSIVNKLGDQEIDNIATASFTEIEFEQDVWAEIRQGTTKRYIKPKEHK